MLKNYTFLLYFSLFFSTLFSVDPNYPEADTVIHVHIDNKQEATNTVNLNNTTKKTVRCSHVLGESLKECVQSLKKTKQKKILSKFSKHHRSAYFKTLSKDEYRNFLDEYTENEWQKLFAQLSEDEKNQWPKTIQEQKSKLDEIKKIADEDYQSKAHKTALVAAGLFIVMTPIIAVPLSTATAISLAYASLDSEEKETKKYINEKFG